MQHKWKKNPYSQTVNTLIFGVKSNLFTSKCIGYVLPFLTRLLWSLKEPQLWLLPVSHQIWNGRGNLVFKFKVRWNQWNTVCNLRFCRNDGVHHSVTELNVFTVKLRCLSDSSEERSEKLSPAKQHQATRSARRSWICHLSHRHTSPKGVFKSLWNWWSIQTLMEDMQQITLQTARLKIRACTWQPPLQACWPDSGFLKHSGSWSPAPTERLSQKDGNQ